MIYQLSKNILLRLRKMKAKQIVQMTILTICSWCITIYKKCMSGDYLSVSTLRALYTFQNAHMLSTTIALNRMS